MNNCKFKVGDKVYNFRYGWGEVTEYNTDFDYPIEASFKPYEKKPGYTAEYAACGRENLIDLNPTLLTIDEAAKFGIYLPKKKKTVTLKQYANVMQDCDKNYYFYGYFSSKEGAESEKYPREKLVAAAVPYEITFQADEE